MIGTGPDAGRTPRRERANNGTGRQENGTAAWTQQQQQQQRLEVSAHNRTVFGINHPYERGDGWSLASRREVSDSPRYNSRGGPHTLPPPFPRAILRVRAHTLASSRESGEERKTRLSAQLELDVVIGRRRAHPSSDDRWRRARQRARARERVGHVHAYLVTDGST